MEDNLLSGRKRKNAVEHSIHRVQMTILCGGFETYCKAAVLSMEGISLICGESPQGEWLLTTPMITLKHSIGTVTLKE